MKSGQVVLIIVVLSIVGCGFLLLFLIPRWRGGSNPLLPNTHSGCIQGRVYNDLRGICALPEGSTCNTYADCATGLYCNGRCLSTDVPQGKLDTYCPCEVGLLCVTGKDGYGYCKLPPKSACNQDSQCASNFCMNSRQLSCEAGESCLCSQKLQTGSRCDLDNQCSTNNCSLGVCQNPGVQTGTLDSICTFHGCTEGSCWRDRCSNGTSKIGDSCAFNPCSPGLICSSGNMVCMLPPICTNCLAGYVCKNGLCIADKGMLTSYAYLCETQRCQSPAVQSFVYPWNGSLFEPLDTWKIQLKNMVVGTGQFWMLDISKTLYSNSQVYASSVQCFTLINDTPLLQYTNGDLYRGREKLTTLDQLWTAIAVYNNKLYYQLENTLYIYPNQTVSKIDRLLYQGYLLEGNYYGFNGLQIQYGDIIDAYFNGTNGVLLRPEAIESWYEGTLNTSIFRIFSDNSRCAQQSTLLYLYQECLCT